MSTAVLVTLAATYSAQCHQDTNLSATIKKLWLCSKADLSGATKKNPPLTAMPGATGGPAAPRWPTLTCRRRCIQMVQRI